MVFCRMALFAQIKNNVEQSIIVDVDSVAGKHTGFNTTITADATGKEIYTLNVRYKLNKTKRSSINENSDFMFTFYIIPNKKMTLKEVSLPEEINSNISSIKAELLQAGYDDYFFHFKPIFKINNKYYLFENCIIVGQAFDLQEDSQYFPKYGAGSNRFELNLLAKPYSSSKIDSLRKVISKDFTSMIPFGTFIEDFYDKWFISKIDRQNKVIDFWINLKPIHDSEYSFGRITTGLKYKIGEGIIGFTIIPNYNVFNGFFKDSPYPVEFNFKESVDLAKFIQ